MRRPHIHPATQAYFLAVMANGGTYTTARYLLVNKLIGDLWACGAWPRMDDAWLLVAENATQALVSLKQNRLATAVNSPTFTADAGYAFDGATNYIDTGFIPGTHAVAMTGGDLRLSTYERTNVAGNLERAAGLTTSTNSNLSIEPRRAAGTVRVGINCAATTGTATTADSRGMTSASRSGATVPIYKNGALFDTVTPASTDTVLPTHALYIGCQNNAGTAGGFSARTVGWVEVGASLTAVQEAAAYAALQSFMTAIGAQV